MKASKQANFSIFFQRSSLVCDDEQLMNLCGRAGGFFLESLLSFKTAISMIGTTWIDGCRGHQGAVG